MVLVWTGSIFGHMACCNGCSKHCVNKLSLMYTTEGITAVGIPQGTLGNQMQREREKMRQSDRERERERERE